MSFERSLKAVGLTRSDLDTGPRQTRITIENIQQLREVVDVQGDEETRRKRFDALFKGTPSFEDAYLRAAEEYVFGLNDGFLAQVDEGDPAFPTNVYVEAAADLVVDGEKDLTTATLELRKAVYAKVTIKAGGYIVVNSTPLEFICEELIVEGAPPEGKGHFNILGVQGATHTDLAKPGAPGQAATGAQATCTGGDTGKVGIAPGPSTPGGNGARGIDGTPSQFASIMVHTSLTVAAGVELLVATYSGAGGNGQNGGAGADGGQGGNGGPGTVCGCTGRNGGPGHAGGIGGKGGKAGDGGNGVDAAANIGLVVPAADFPKVQQTAITKVVSPGKAGERGVPGGKGAGGAAGVAASKHSDAGTKGNEGSVGQIGDPGIDGTKVGQPAAFNPQPG